MFARDHRLLPVESGFLRLRLHFDLKLVRGQLVPKDLSSPQEDLGQEVRYRDASQRLSDRPNRRD